MSACVVLWDERWNAMHTYRVLPLFSYPPSRSPRPRWRRSYSSSGAMIYQRHLVSSSLCFAFPHSPVYPRFPPLPWISTSPLFTITVIPDTPLSTHGSTYFPELR
jgi:hypothetical protein